MPENGKVKWFSNVKGYGFLIKEGGDQDIFVHYSSVQGEGYKKLEEGEEVTFEMSDGDRGPQAKNVIRVKKQAKEAEKKAATAGEGAPAPQAAEK